MNIGKRIQELRISNKLSQEELAKKLNISNKTVSSWECNRTEPTFEQVEAMCSVFHCSKADFVSDHCFDMPSELLAIVKTCNERQLKLITEFAALVTNNNYLSDSEN